MRSLLLLPVLAVLAALPAAAQNGDVIFGPTTIYYTVDEGPVWSEIREQGEGTLRVLYVPAEGFAYEDEAGRLTGVTIEIVRDFAEWAREEYGVDLDLEFVAEEDWRQFYARVSTGVGGVLGLGNVTITEERRAELQFSPPYLTNVAVLITRDDASNLEGLDAIGDAFDGLRPLAFEGTLHERRLEALRDAYHPDATMAFARSNDEIIERVAAGGYYAYVDGYNFWRAVDRGLPLKRHAVGDDPAEEFGIIMPLESDWTEPVDAFFATGDGYVRSERYRQLLVEHLGADVAAVLLAASE